MKLKTLWDSLAVEDRDDLAVASGTTYGHLRNVTYGYRTCDPVLAVELERCTARQIRRWDLRPDDWHRIWPELIGADGAPSVPQREAA